VTETVVLKNIGTGAWDLPFPSDVNPILGTAVEVGGSDAGDDCEALPTAHAHQTFDGNDHDNKYHVGPGDAQSVTVHAHLDSGVTNVCQGVAWTITFTFVVTQDADEPGGSY
jgi:hypothetical protein